MRMEDYREYLVWFGQQVRALRLKKGISQEALAGLSRLDRTYIGGIERGERNPSLKNILKLAFILGVEPSELFTGWPHAE